MRILFLTHSFNSLAQRLYCELTALGHQVSIEFDISDSVTEEAVALFKPDLVLAPFLKRAIPESVWSRHLCLVVHPGIPGDRGPSALDWAIQQGLGEWAVTVLQAEAEMDAGPVWAAAGFPMAPTRKASLYRNQVTEAAVRAVRQAVERVEAGNFTPERVPGQAHELMKQANRRIDWATESSQHVLAKLNAADGFPGMADELFGQPCHLFDAWPEATLKGLPGSLLGRRETAILRATADGAVWIGHVKPRGGIKLPATLAFPEAAELPELPLDGWWKAPAPTWQDIAYEEAAGVGFLSFEFYNGAMSTAQCRRLTEAFHWATTQPTQVIVLRGGSDFWSNGIHLNTIESAESPADESWANINAIDDLAEAILRCETQLTVAAVGVDIRTLVKTNATRGVIKDAVNNLAYYNSADGAGYNTSDYHSDSNGIYVNSELKETIREIFPGLVKLFIRNDSTGTKYPDYSIAYDTRGQSPLEAFTCALGTLKEGGIDYTAVDLEPSLRRMMDYNAFGKRRTDSGTTNVSYLDHFLYAIVSAAKFGFLTRQGSDGEPSANSGRGHGLSTNGVLTVTDVIYALDMSSGTIGDLTTTLNSIPNYLCFYLRDDIVNAIENMNLYDMALDHRVEQAEYISRSSGSFTTSQMGLHKFYMGGDYPIASLVPSACAGDAGLPNGGENAVTPTSNTTTMSTKTSVSQNDFRTYYPKVADGLGATNTAEFLLSLIPRACWDGAGPFYYAPSGAETKSFSWPGKGTRTVHVYYKPNGEIYAYVYKPSSSSSAWEYYYPVSGNDLADETGQRSNRYLEKIESDYYLVKFKFVNEYLTPTDYVAVPPVNPDGGSYASPNSKFRMKLIKASDNPASQKFYLEEKYKQTDPRRECKSQEEAIYRNYQWLCFDKKLAFVIPLHVGLMTNVEFGGYLFAEGNGFLGLVNSRKGPQNGYWLSNETDFPIPEYANSGIGIGDKTTGNSPDYMESHIPGDGRLTLLLSDNFCNLLPGLDTPGLFFSAIIGKGYAFPGAIACSIPTVLRLGFLQEAMVTADSTDIANESSAVWQNRNKLLPLIVALTGSLRDVTRYNASTTGHNYNYTGKHKLPIAELLEGVLFPLAKPHMRYLTDTAHSSGSTAYWGTRWLQRVENESNGTFSCFTPNIKNETDTDYFAPKKELRTLISILAGNGPKTSDGLIPLIADNTRLVSRVLALLQNLGGAGKAAERQTLFKGLEQITSSVKAGQSETMTRGISLSDNTSYKWMFTAREEDILLDDLLTYDGPVLPDDLRWDDFDSAFDLLKKFMDGEKDITGNIINIMNAVLTNQLTDPETESLVYVAGKLFGKYADNTWIYHGQTDDFDALYKLCTYLPYLHADLQDAGSGKNYLNLIDNVLWLLQNESSLLYYIVDNMNTRYSSEQVFKDLHDFSHSEIVYGSNAVVWRDMSNLLNEISGLAGNPLSPEELTVMFGHYGYQQN